MFQPNPKPLIPLILKAKVPGWLFVGALVAQFVITQVNQNSEPTCSIKFENIHYSSSVKRNLGKDSVKLNLVTSCSQPQKYSEIVAEISELRNDKPVKIYTSSKIRQMASTKKPTDAEFLDFWVNCKRDSVHFYRGEASGEVLLTSGAKISVSGDTGKFLAVPCNFKAK